MFYLLFALRKRFVTSFPAFCAFRPTLACSYVTKIDIIRNSPTDHPQIFAKGVTLTPEKGCHKWRHFAPPFWSYSRFYTWGGAFIIPFPVIGGLPGLTLAPSPNALCCCRASRAHLVVAMIDVAWILSVSIPTYGILLLYLCQCS